jgi:hypothetical protein
MAMQGVTLNDYNYYLKLGAGLNPDGSKASAGNIAWGKVKAANSYVIATSHPGASVPVPLPFVVTKVPTPTEVLPIINGQPIGYTTFNDNSITGQPTGGYGSHSPIDDRKNQMNAFTGWDNDGAIRAKQQKSWDIYINTGLWNTAEQLQLNKDAEAMRTYINPTYGGVPWGTPDKSAADSLILPNNQGSSITGVVGGALGGLDTGSLMKAGLGIGALFLVMSMFRGR